MFPPLITAYFKALRKTLSFHGSFLGPGSFLQPTRNQKGQTIVEYVLLIVVILSLAYGLARNFIQPLRDYGSAVFTNTIACALEYGQLPAEVVGEQGCEASMKGGTGSSGGGGGSGGGGSGGKNGGGSQANNNQRNGKDKKGKDSKNGGTEDQSGAQKDSQSSESADSKEDKKDASNNAAAGKPGSRGGTTVVGSNGQILKLSDRPTGVELGDRSGQIIIEGGASGGGVDSYQPRRIRQRKPIYKAIEGELLNEYVQSNQNNKEKEKSVTRAVASGGFEAIKKNRKIELGPPREKKLAEDKKEEWDLSKMVRMGLIILMVLAIVIFVFFQLSQIRKNSSAT
ncbi:MAG: hypothetical protein RJB66_2198 [Pseudomonadota bacterium]|jgi:hypothetical protein